MPIRKACTSLALSACLLLPAGLPLAGAELTTETATPIKHVVVIFQENVSFDHYFATYPFALNPPNETRFDVRKDMPYAPSVNGLTEGLIEHNPNSTAPFRLDRSQVYTCDQDHDYTAELQAFNHGLMDKFPENTGSASGSCASYGKGNGLVMGYYDGNSVTALWNYAQYFAMSDNSYGTTVGPSTPGALNLVAGSTAMVDPSHIIGDVSDGVSGSAVISDPDPYYDDCGSPGQLAVTGKNIGDLLNAAGLTWGWFQGGFGPTATVSGKASCGAKSYNLQGKVVGDYSAHHEPFQYYAQTANPHHLPPTSIAKIGYTDQANHQYDLKNFWTAVAAHNMPAVSFLKAKRSQDGHAGYSSPTDEQVFIVNTLNRLQQTPEWASTAVIISYDDSDGWYDHVMPPVINQSGSSADNNSCGDAANPLGGIQGRCGYGPRLPLLVISPYAKSDYVDHNTTDQSSIIRFIEDNWLRGERIGNGSFDAVSGSLMPLFDFSGRHRAWTLYLDPLTGALLNK